MAAHLFVALVLQSQWTLSFGFDTSPLYRTAIATLLGAAGPKDSQQEERGSPAGYYAGSIASRGLGCVLMLHPTATASQEALRTGPLATSAPRRPPH